MKAIVIILFLLMTSCASPPKNAESVIAIDDVERLPLGSTEDQVVGTFGQPSLHERKQLKGGKPYVLWHYFGDTSNTRPRMSLSFDADSNHLQNKAFLPKANEPERNLNFILKSKFQTYSFQDISFPECGRDHKRSDAMMVNAEHGTYIHYWKKSRNIIAVTWGPPNEAQNTVENLRKCSERK